MMPAEYPTAAAPMGAEITPIPLRALVPWLWLAALLLMIVYLVSLDQGTVSQAGLFVHEFMHDGRHLLAVPCH